MRKYFDAIQRIAGNVVTVNASGVGYDDLAVITSSRGDSLAQVIRLEGQQVSLQVFAAPRASRTTTACGSCTGRCRCRFRTACWAACSTVPSGRGTVRAGHGRDDRPRFAGRQPGAAADARPDGRDRHSHDRRFQLAGRIPEAAHFLGGGRAVQRTAGPDRAAGRRGHHHPGRHGAAARRLPEVPSDLRGGRRAGRAIMFVHTAADPVVEACWCPTCAWLSANSTRCGANASWSC